MQKEQERRIKIFDTTLRDGEQTPGVNLNILDKLKIAQALNEMRIDVIEAGFAGSSEGDFEAVKAVAKESTYSAVASLSRSVESDIIASAKALEKAKTPIIHVFIATSDIHMKYKLNKEPDQVYEMACNAVRLAKKYTPFVEFSCEDATRSDWEFIYRVLEGVIAEGATMLNLPDTVGYTTPSEYYDFITSVRKNVKNIDKAEISVHCHNDLGLAVANSLAAIRAGATQVEGTINGIGERAGNAAIEEILMNLYTRKDFYNVTYGVDTTKIYRTSRLVSNLTNMNIPANKAIVGANAFVHQSGIHQHGVLKNPLTYEILSPEAIGAEKGGIMLGKLSGKHAFKDKLVELGFHLNEEELEDAFTKFKAVADRKREVTDKDIIAIASQKVSEVPSVYSVKSFRIYSGNGIDSIANLVIQRDGQNLVAEATGSGPVDAAFKAIDEIVKLDITLEKYEIRAVTEGKDALGEVSVLINDKKSNYRGRAVSVDIIEASINAYVGAINRLICDVSTKVHQ